jgi:uncharacterized protein involved in type VI secretion and phage assembly
MKMQTLYQGIVAENYDKDNKGRLKVKIPLMDDGSDVVVLVNLMRGYATKKGGFFFVPEKNDIVIVGFLGDDFERGVILGTLFEKGNGFHDGHLCEKNNNKVIASRSGAQINFLDVDGKEKITVKTPKGQEMVFDDEKEVVTVKSKDGTDIKLNGKDGEITLTAKEKLTIACGEAKLTFTKNGDIKLKGANVSFDGKTIGIKSSGKGEFSGQTLELKGSTGAKMTSGAKLELSGSATTEIKAPLVKING